MNECCSELYLLCVLVCVFVQAVTEAAHLEIVIATGKILTLLADPGRHLSWTALFSFMRTSDPNKRRL